MMRRFALPLALTLIFAVSAVAHNGVTNFVPTVPDPSTMIMDGADDDWGWYDQGEFAIIEMSAETYGGDRVVSDADMNMLYLHAWSPPPDNAYYVFTRITDDTLRIQEGPEDGSWWNDDNLKQGFDMDHGGGNWVENEEEGISLADATAMGYHFSMSPAWNQVSGMRTSPSEAKYPDPTQYNWHTDPPYAFGFTTILPADYVNFSANVEMTFEYVIRTFDEINIDDLESSIPHVWEEDQVVHINIGYEDGDWGPHGEDQIWHQPGATFETNNFETGTDNWAVLTTDGIVADSFLNRNAGDCGVQGCDPATGAGGGTAVENTTWARIKSQF